MNSWKKIPDGTRVRHSREGYEGWIDGLTECHDRSKVNPDGKTQYRIRLHGLERRKIAAEEDLLICNDLDVIFSNSADLLKKPFNRMPSEPQVLPLTVYSLGKYDPYHGGQNPHRSDHTRMILDLKKRRLPAAVEYFVNRLEIVLAKGFPICAVPSSDPHNQTTGLGDLVKRLAVQGRVDATSCLVRHRGVIASSSASVYRQFGEDRREISRHLGTIRVRNEGIVRGKVVLLMDDIVQSGTSLMACRKLLLDAGASEVMCLTLGSHYVLRMSNQMLTVTVEKLVQGGRGLARHGVQMLFVSGTFRLGRSR